MPRAPYVQRITRIPLKNFPITYLGVPLFLRKRKMVYLEHLLAKVRQALEEWKAL